MGKAKDKNGKNKQHSVPVRIEVVGKNGKTISVNEYDSQLKPQGSGFVMVLEPKE